MVRKIVLSAFVILAGLTVLQAHDMYLKFRSYFLPPHSKVNVELLNGTFEQSENPIERSRMVDVTIAGASDGYYHPGAAQWTDVDSTSVLSFETGDPGTYVVGVSTAPRAIELTAEEFNEYLDHDGVLDILEHRKRDGKLGQGARERYSKHVKAVFQVGDSRTGRFGAKLNYPVEIVPQQNPYCLQPGDEFTFVVLRDGRPVANQLVYASHEHHHTHDAAGRHAELIHTRTNQAGAATISLTQAGRWYVRLIHMTPVNEPDVDYESLWATLTFEVR